MDKGFDPGKVVENGMNGMSWLGNFVIKSVA